MRGCHFQDVPGKKSICLRELCQPGERPIRHRICDERREEVCQYRAWNVDIRIQVVSQRSEMTDSCPGCRGKHDSLVEMHACVCRCRMEAAFKESPAFLECGSTDDLFEGAPAMTRANLWRKLRKAVVERDRGVCQDCGRQLGHLPKWYTEVHHIVPRVHGGGDHPSNLKTLCVECHRKYTNEMFFSRMERSDEAYQAARLFKK
jgi:5-methylcytosine-specific restriction endonuclease McrA